MAVEDTQFQHPEAVSKLILLYRTSINFLFSSLSTVIQDEASAWTSDWLSVEWLVMRTVVLIATVLSFSSPWDHVNG